MIVIANKKTAQHTEVWASVYCAERGGAARFFYGSIPMMLIVTISFLPVL